MPELNKESLEKAYYKRFIRVGNIIYYSDNQSQNHDSLANQSGVPIDPELCIKVVDDGGYITKKGEKYVAFDSTSTCFIRGDKINAREVTNKILKKLQS